MARYVDMANAFVETLIIGEVFTGKALVEFISQRVKREISWGKASQLLDGVNSCIPLRRDAGGLRHWKRIM